MSGSSNSRRTNGAQAFSLEFPDVRGLDQHEEWCRVHLGNESRTIRFHDYARIFEVEGLYEELFYGRLACQSPRTLADMLQEELERAGVPPGSLRGLDLGAGNGMVGEELKRVGVDELVGVDLLPEAAAAAKRDRPGVYRDYVVADLTQLDDASERRLRAVSPNLLSTVAALGFGDMPSPAFAAAWNLIERDAWVMFNIKEAFLSAEYQYGFSKLVRQLTEAKLFEVRQRKSYRHRLALDGTPLQYVAFVGRKHGQIPPDWLEQLGE